MFAPSCELTMTEKRAEPILSSTSQASLVREDGSEHQLCRTWGGPFACFWCRWARASATRFVGSGRADPEPVIQREAKAP